MQKKTRSNHQYNNNKPSRVRATPVPLSDTKVVLLNKPFNVLCQFTSESERKTLKDFVNITNIYPAGRLDRDSEGLLLLTNNGALQHRLSEPKFKLPKTYWVQVEGIPDEASLESLRKGVTLNDGKTQPAKVDIIEEPAHLWHREPPIRERKSIPTTWIALTLTEGRNRQVRRMTAHIGCPTLRLIRAKIGFLSVEGINLGEYQTLNPEQVKELMKYVRLEK